MKETGVSPGDMENRRNLQPLLRSALIALVYLISFILTDLITKQFEVLPGIVTWYPPVGLTYALLLVFGVRFTPAVTIALFLSSVFIYRMPQTPSQLLLWAFVVSLVYAAGAWFLRHRMHLDWQLRKLRDVAWLVLTAVLVSAFLAFLSVSSSALSSAMPRGEVLRAIFHWWIGESVGVLTVTPFLLVYVIPWLKRFVDGQPVNPPKHFSFPSPALTSIGQAASLVLILYWVFGTRVLDEFRPMYLMTLPLIWIAIEHGFKRLTVAILVLNFGVVLAIWLFGFDLAHLAELELLMIVICMVGLLMGAIVTERVRAEEEQNLSKTFLEDVLRTTPSAVFTIDLERKITSWNLMAERITGYTASDAIGKTCDILASTTCADHCRLFDDCFKKPGDYKECEIVTKDGRHVTTLNNFDLLKDPSGSVIGGIESYIDITERRQVELVLRESEERYRDLVENSQELICTHDLQGRILSTNPAGAKMLGLEMVAVLKMNIRDILAPERKGDFESYITSIKNEGKSSGLMLIQTNNGQRRVWEYNNTLRKEGLATPIVRGMARDITEQKQAEDALHQKIYELEQFHNLTVGRELKMIELKKEVNALLKQAGQPEEYLIIDEEQI